MTPFLLVVKLKNFEICRLKWEEKQRPGDEPTENRDQKSEWYTSGNQLPSSVDPEENVYIRHNIRLGKGNQIIEIKRRK